MSNSLESITPSHRHVEFVEGILAGKSLDKAGKDAGFVHPDRDAYPILATPQVRQYVRKKLRGRAETEDLAVCYNFLIEVVRDERNDKKLRVDTAKFLYAHHMPGQKALDAPPDGEKAPSEMSNEELRNFIEQGEAELASRAEPVEGDTSQPIDSFL